MMALYNVVFTNARTGQWLCSLQQERPCMDSSFFRTLRSTAASEARADRKAPRASCSMITARISKDGNPVATIIDGVDYCNEAWTSIHYNGQIVPVRGMFA